jgi:hypothetical protein
MAALSEADRISYLTFLNSAILFGEAALEFGDRGCRSVMKNLGDRGWCLR